MRVQAGHREKANSPGTTDSLSFTNTQPKLNPKPNQTSNSHDFVFYDMQVKIRDVSDDPQPASVVERIVNSLPDELDRASISTPQLTRMATILLERLGLINTTQDFRGESLIESAEATRGEASRPNAKSNRHDSSRTILTSDVCSFTLFSLFIS